MVKFFFTQSVKYFNMNERFKFIRKSKKLTQKEVAKNLGLTLSAYSNYEQGIREPSINIIIKICKFFKVTSDYLLGLVDYE